ncbi:butyrophilin subfamily 2 member A2-like [Pelodiscus sinensis]|uniref:butyrophilin subfamily 2 member A2-like n=1 Tax=Pelodiscus sinensis TaxID=13735 RepID=UPI003F6CA5A5
MATRWWLCVCSLGLLFLTPCALSEKFSLSGSPRPVVGIVGQDVVLPCQLSPAARLPRMDLWWRKIGTAFTPVHEYSDVGPSEQPGEGYQNRTELFLQEFSNGNISLKLKRLQVADAGTYHCFVRNPQWSQEATTELQVAAVTPLFIDVLGPQNQGIGLACRSAGWFPKPELQWVGKNQLNRTMESVTNMTQDGENLYSFVSRVTVTEDNGDISCIVRNGLLKTEQQLAIHLSSDAFPRMSSWLVAFWALFAAVLIAAGACACFGLTGKRKASKKKLAEKEALLTLEGKNTTLESECKERRERLHAVRKDFDAECQKLRHEMETVENENISLKSECQELGKNLDTQKKAFEAECQKLHHDLGNKRKIFEAECSKLQENLETEKKEKEDLKSELEQLRQKLASVTLDLENNHSGLTASDNGRTSWHNRSSMRPAPHLPQEKQPQGLHFSLPPETSKQEKTDQGTLQRKDSKAAATNLSREGDSNRAGAATPGNTPQPAGGKEPPTPPRPKPIIPPKPKAVIQRNARFPNSTP